MNISRTNLYNKIWAIGISKTASELRVPYNQLKLACAEHDIPLPSQAYWGLLYMGNEKPEKTPLPTPENNTVIFLDTVRKAIEKNTTSPAITETKSIEQTPAKETIKKQPKPTYFDYFSEEEQAVLLNAYNSIKMNKTLSAKPHEEIVKYKQKLKNPDPYYRREPKLTIKSGADDIFPEALIFIDSLFKALEKANASIVVKMDETEVHYKHYLFTLRFRAPSTKISLKPGDKEYETYRTYKYVAKGILSIEIDRNERWHKNYPRTTTVTQKTNEPFDELLKRLFVKIFSLAPIDDEVRRLRLIEDAEEQKRLEERARIKAIHANELIKTESLIANSINYFLSKLIKDYINAEIDTDTEEFDWAVNKANWIKNSTEQVDTILTEDDKAKLIKNLLYGKLK